MKTIDWPHFTSALSIVFAPAAAPRNARFPANVRIAVARDAAFCLLAKH